MRKEMASADPWAVGWVIRSVVVIAFLAALAVPMGWLPILSVAPVEGVGGSGGGRPGVTVRTLAPTATTTPLPLFTPTPHTIRVGIIAGHTGSDSGALCPDGLREVDINLGIARRVVALLESEGWEVDLLEEFDERLSGYRADALVSIHADSCNVPNKSGFKVAQAESGYNVEAEDLVNCIIDRYAEWTGLAFDPNTITYDMRRYHAYYEIDRNTPAAIIEVGFMKEDRVLLTQKQDVVARGIVDGIKCFIEGRTP